MKWLFHTIPASAETLSIMFLQILENIETRSAMMSLLQKG